MEGSGSDLKSYVEAIYRLALILVALSAVLMLSIGGFMYLTSAGNTAQLSSAKSVIFDALIGLVIALVAWLVLYIINPDLTSPTLPTTTPGVTAPAAIIPDGVVTVRPPTPGSGSGCGGYRSTNNQCGDASQDLSDILQCMYQIYPNTEISSISDSAGLATCKQNWTDPVCAHARTSCHYGGGSDQSSAQCQKSHAADIRVRNASGNVSAEVINGVIAAARTCGARIKDESQGPAPHIHISTKTTCCNL